MEMSLLEQIRLHKEISQKIEELEEQKKALGSSILNQMSGSSLKVPGFLVKRFNRLTIAVSIEEARAFQAVKLEEAVDKEKIKALYKNGQPIAGVREISYIQISYSDWKEQDGRIYCECKLIKSIGKPFLHQLFDFCLIGNPFEGGFLLKSVEERRLYF